jgi:hypothetical protein
VTGARPASASSTASWGKAPPVLADLGEQHRGGDRADTGEAGEDRGIGVVGDGGGDGVVELGQLNVEQLQQPGEGLRGEALAGDRARRGGQQVRAHTLLYCICWIWPVYPGLDLLQEVGRVTIAGARLDLQMGMLWHHLDRQIDLEQARRAPGQQQRDRVRRLARERLRGDLLNATLAAVDAANVAAARRKEIIHQDWVLRGRDALRPVAELADIAPEDLPAYFEEWDREAKVSLPLPPKCDAADLRSGQLP